MIVALFRFAAIVAIASMFATVPAGASEPIRKEYELLLKIPRQIIEPMIAKPGAIILGRGGCRYLYAAVVTGDEAGADDAWKSIEATFAQQIDDGGLEGGGNPGDSAYTVYSIRVENMYFFLQELGHALLIVQASPFAPHFHDRIEALRPKLRKACDFIQKGYPTIEPKVGHTANRLLIAAKAFGLCGLVLGDEKMKETSGRLVKAALRRRDSDGIFIENGGRDSSYDCVCVLMGTHLSLYLPNPELEKAFGSVMAWEKTRVKPTGEVQVSGNTRTGVGKEPNKAGIPKGVNYGEVSQTFWYYGALHNDPALIETALKVEEYRRSKR